MSTRLFTTFAKARRGGGALPPSWETIFTEYAVGAGFPTTPDAWDWYNGTLPAPNDTAQIVFEPTDYGGQKPPIKTIRERTYNGLRLNLQGTSGWQTHNAGKTKTGLLMPCAVNNAAGFRVQTMQCATSGWNIRPTCWLGNSASGGLKRWNFSWSYPSSLRVLFNPTGSADSNRTSTTWEHLYDWSLIRHQWDPSTGVLSSWLYRQALGVYDWELYRVNTLDFSGVAGFDSDIVFDQFMVGTAMENTIAYNTIWSGIYVGPLSDPFPTW